MKNTFKVGSAFLIGVLFTASFALAVSVNKKSEKAQNHFNEELTVSAEAGAIAALQGKVLSANTDLDQTELGRLSDLGVSRVNSEIGNSYSLPENYIQIDSIGNEGNGFTVRLLRDPKIELLDTDALSEDSELTVLPILLVITDSTNRITDYLSFEQRRFLPSEISDTPLLEGSKGLYLIGKTKDHSGMLLVTLADNYTSDYAVTGYMFNTEDGILKLIETPQGNRKDSYTLVVKGSEHELVKAVSAELGEDCRMCESEYSIATYKLTDDGFATTSQETTSKRYVFGEQALDEWLALKKLKPYWR